MQSISWCVFSIVANCGLPGKLKAEIDVVGLFPVYTTHTPRTQHAQMQQHAPEYQSSRIDSRYSELRESFDPRTLARSSIATGSQYPYSQQGVGPYEPPQLVSSMMGSSGLQAAPGLDASMGLETRLSLAEPPLPVSDVESTQQVGTERSGKRSVRRKPSARKGKRRKDPSDEEQVDEEKSDQSAKRPKKVAGVKRIGKTEIACDFCRGER